MIDKRKLRARMIGAGFTQKALAAAVGISENTMCAKINGRSQFTVQEAEKVCRLLGIRTAGEKCQIFLC